VKLLAVLLALATIVCSAPREASALTPSEGQVLPYGTVVEGTCKSTVGQQTEAGEQWTVETADPQRSRVAAGATLAPMSLPPGLVPFGDFWLPDEATGEHAHIYQASSDPHFSAAWGWNYDDEWALNLQGGSNTEELGPGSNSSTCSAAHTYDTSGEHNLVAGLGTFAGQFEGESVATGAGLALDRPGPYALDQWRLELHYTRVAAKEFEVHPFLPKSCPGGSRLFTETPSSGELEAVAGAEANYRLAGPPAEMGTNEKGEAERFEWVAQTYCMTATATHFYILGAPGTGTYSGNMSQWPSSPYINQYEAGARLGLPTSAGDARAGAGADGPAALMMGMRDALGSAMPTSGWPSLKDVYERTVDAQGNFDPAQGLKLLQELGFTEAQTIPLPADRASVADAGPPYPIVYPNPTNEAAIDRALQRGPVAVETAFGSDEWGMTSSGHLLLIVGVDPQHPGDYVVDDPAGDYFSSLTNHYGAGSYGYGVDYPKAWMLAYATNTLGRGLIEFGPYTAGSASVIETPSEGGLNTGITNGGSPRGAPSTPGPGAAAVARPSAARIRALLGREIVPSGSAARIAALRRHGLALKLRALEAGTASVAWYAPASAARLARTPPAKPVLVSSGRLRFAAAGTKQLSMRLTSAGKTLLRHHPRQLRLMALGVFDPTGSAAIRVNRTFALS
jgi:hypothetical protein